MDLKKLKDKIKKEGDYEKGKVLGLPYVMWRHPDFEHWCGYVGVEKDSALYGKEDSYYTESENGLSELEKKINHIKVHGGLTFAGKLSKKKNGGVYWYFGFDCGHCGDITPFMAKKYPEYIRRTDIYRDKAYVKKEIKKLAKQIKEITKVVKNKQKNGS